MKKLLWIVVLGLLWCGNANTGEPMKEVVSYLDPGFVLSKDQHKLTYKNKKDDILIYTIIPQSIL